MSKRIKSKNLVDELPLDCWGKIVSFLRHKRDFMSLLRSVKGLFEYISFVLPHCTEHIGYSLPDFKDVTEVMKIQKRYVSNLSYRPFFFTKFHLESYGSAPDFLRFLLLKFPNLLCLRIILKVHRRKNIQVDVGAPIPPETGDQYESIRAFSTDFSRLPSALRTLDLQFSVPSLRIHLPYMSRLFRLTISRKCLCTIRKMTENEKMFLDITGFEKNLPNLRYFQIHCCSRRRSLEKTGLHLEHVSKLPQLRYLTLENEVPEERVFPSFKELTFLNLIGASSRYITSIQKLTKLKILKISVIPKNEREKRYRMELSMNILIEGFPFLEKVRIRAMKSCKHMNNKGTLCMKNLPRLTTVKLVGKKGNNPLIVFPVSISAPKLELLSTIEWGGSVDFTDGTGSELKKITFFRSEVGPIVKKNFLNFKNLEEFQYRVSITNPLSPESDERMVMKNFPQLRKIFFPDVVIVEISNCPKLESIRVHPEPNITMENLPSLNEVIVSVDRQTDLDVYYDFVKKVNRDFPTVKTISLHPYRFKDLQILDGDSWIDHNVEKLIVDFRRPFTPDRNFCIDLRNFSHIQNFSISQLHFNFPKVFTLKKFTKLEKLDLNSMKFADITGEFSRIVLEDLPACKELHIGSGFGTVHNVTIKNVPVTKLIVDLMECLRGAGGYFRSSLQIESNNFPLVETMEITAVRKRDRNVTKQVKFEDFFRIGILSGLKNLKLITLNGYFHNIQPFVMVVRGLDLDNIMITCSLRKEGFFDLTDSLGNPLKPSLIFTKRSIPFSEYISHLAKFGIEIEVEQF